jgi:hypothetical protein
MDTGEYDGDYAQLCQSWNIEQARKMVYIQSDSERKLPHHFDAACAMYGAIESCLNYRLTSFEEVQSGKFDNLIRSSHFVGSVEFMREVFTRVNKIPQPILNNDSQYHTFTLEELRDRVLDGNEKWFVKPFQQKLFSGLVVDKYSISSLREFPDDLNVMVYNVVDGIKSEWRIYVMNNKIQDSRNYSGDFKISPDYETVENKIKCLKDQLPSVYTMDVGVYEDIYSSIRQRTFIVEFNDMYAIGNYGVENTLYLRMLKERYFEIIKN